MPLTTIISVFCLLQYLPCPCGFYTVVMCSLPYSYPEHSISAAAGVVSLLCTVFDHSCWICLQNSSDRVLWSLLSCFFYTFIFFGNRCLVCVYTVNVRIMSGVLFIRFLYLSHFILLLILITIMICSKYRDIFPQLINSSFSPLLRWYYFLLPSFSFIFCYFGHITYCYGYSCTIGIVVEQTISLNVIDVIFMNFH